MSSSGETYRPGGGFNPVSTLTAAVGGVIAALAVAAIVWTWERSPIPTIVILTPLLQGFALSFAITLLFSAAKLRSPMLGIIIGFICGAISAAAVHYGHYVTDVFAYRDSLRRQAGAIAEAIGPQGAQAVLAEANANPFKTFDDDISEPQTGKRGFIGHVHLRAKQGVKIKRAEVTGIGMWVLWSIEGLMIIGIAAVMGRARAAVQPATVPGETARTLISSS